MTVEDRKPRAESENHADHHRGDGHSHAHDDHQHAHAHGHTHQPHDWHSENYVDYWIKRDDDRADERRPRIRQMVAMAKLPHDAPIAALDIGAGYGFVSEQVLRAFPNAHVTLQDFSALMLERARGRLADAATRTSFVLSDLTDPAWVDQVGGPFDLIVSAIAIHNLRSTAAIAACYRGVAQLLKPGAPFLDYDLFAVVGGIETHIGLMQEAGMSRVSRAWDDGHAAIILAHGRRSPR
jgi:2-polyprenyl-3-methyl-5-hydroxy-6-metoxy-1,4-benzoquinol methylase